MSISIPLTSLCLSSSVEDLQPVQEFCFYKPNIVTPQHEYHWGLQWGELNQDKYCGLGNISVRGDIARLLSDEAITLIPLKDTVNAIWEVSEYNINKNTSVHNRRRCFDVLPIQPYQYRLVASTLKQHKEIPLFSFDPQTSTFQKFNYPYDSLPTFTLNVYPFHSIMHSYEVVSRESHYYVCLAARPGLSPELKIFAALETTTAYHLTLAPLSTLYPVLARISVQVSLNIAILLMASRRPNEHRTESRYGSSLCLQRSLCQYRSTVQHWNK